ncbi:type II secretion system assembly factor GspB [Dickeya chrysanthemi]|uniref:type II secretion system assembly factor GspB n=1 Tax=Dickeya chrysanthemi TaxID=556 RepID=UPI00039F8F24|nr:type II secretion system assembly factor GspB [Dickeya chrysanthemi]
MKNTPEVTSPSQTGYRIPGYLLVVYALLLFTLGWFGHQHWMDIHSPSVPAATVAALPMPPAVPATATPEKPVDATASLTPQATVEQRHATTEPPEATQEKAPPKSSVGWRTANLGELPYIAFSAHVYTSDPDKRSVTLNGERYREGDTPYPGLIIEQIEQDMVIFSFDGEPFILDSLQDWPGGKPGSDADDGSTPPPSKSEKTARTTKK